MKLIDRIAINKIINTIVYLVISLAKIFANKTDDTQKVDPSRPRPLKKIINILPLSWRKK